ncbi:MAG: diguanylate cyclase, partial [Pseudomonadota bacterium]|nr:diguanylate cyclase [Pseudomonadota bacterium]
MSARPALSAILGLFVVYALLSGGLLLRQAEAMRRADLAVQAIQAEAARAADLAHHARNLLDPTLNRAEEAARFSAMLRGFRAGRTEAARAAIPGGSGRNPGRDPGRDPDPGLAPGADAAAAAALADLLRAATALAALAPPAPQARSGPAAVAPAGSRAPASGPAPAAAGPTARPHEATAYRADAEALARRIEDAAHALADAYDLRRRQGRLHADAAAARMRRTAAAAGAGGVLLALALGRFGLAPLARRLSARTAALERRLAQAREEATRDPATGLPNLRGARERLTGLMGADARPAVLRLALDHSGSGAFAGRGPLSSDRPVPALRAAARRLRALLRPGELLTRVGEREFAVLIAHVAAPSQAEAAARRLIEAMGEAVVEEGESLRFPVRAGVARAPRGAGAPHPQRAGPEQARAATQRGGGAPPARAHA